MPHGKFKVVFQNNAFIQLQESINYYNEMQKGLGKRFAITVKSTAKQFSKNPFYQIRYDVIGCLPLPKFAFMIHFRINKTLNLIQIFAVLHTYLNPKWDLKKMILQKIGNKFRY